MYKPIDIFNDPEKYIDFLISPDLERLYGQDFDWKEIPNPYNKDNAKKGIIECISAFSNSNLDGGMVVLGIKDKTQEVIGTDHLTEEQLNSLLALPNQNLHNQSFQSKPVSIKNHRVYLFYVPYQERNICHTKSSPNDSE
jgi:predicted HTH transcriptional regulator